MPVSMIVLETAALCLSVLGAGLFLRMERRSVLISVCVAGLAGGASFSLLPEAIGVAAGPYAGLPLAAFAMALLSRRPAMDGLLVFLTGACYWRTWTVFQTWVVEVCESTVALWFFSGFFLLHLPAVLVTFPEFSLPCGWQSQLRGKTGGLRPRHIVELGAALLVLLELAAMALPAEGVHAAVKALLITALFWAALSLLPMLTAYGRKRAQSEAETVYRQDMTTFMNVVRSQRHDYNLHVQTVASLIAQEKWEDCRSYVHALTQDTAEINTVLPISDPAVAALIGNFKTLAAQRGIRLVTDIRDDLSKVVTGAYETNKILGNLLQNALDETECGDIELQVFKRGPCCLLRVSNKVRDPEGFMRRQESIFEQGYTTKLGHDGVGLSSIRALTRQIGGDVTVWLEKDTAHFIASIPLCSQA